MKELARLTGWRPYHNLDARGSDPGFPDLVLLGRVPRNRGLLHFLELKRVGGRLSPHQRDWLEDLGTVRRVTADVYTAADWPRIEALLKGDVA